MDSIEFEPKRIPGTKVPLPKITDFAFNIQLTSSLRLFDLFSFKLQPIDLIYDVNKFITGFA